MENRTSGAAKGRVTVGAQSEIDRRCERVRESVMPLFEDAYSHGTVALHFAVGEEAILRTCEESCLPNPLEYGTRAVATVRLFADSERVDAHIMADTGDCMECLDGGLMHECAHVLWHMMKLGEIANHDERVEYVQGDASRVFLTSAKKEAHDHDELWGHCFAAVYRATHSA